MLLVTHWLPIAVLACIAPGWSCGSTGTGPETPSVASPAVTNDDRERVIAFITRARSERGLPPINVVTDSQPLAAAEREIRRGATPDAAIRTALQRVVESETSEASGWCLPTHDVTRIELPSVVLEQRESSRRSSRSESRPAPNRRPSSSACSSSRTGRRSRAPTVRLIEARL
jgi:hypothetical protein